MITRWRLAAFGLVSIVIVLAWCFFAEPHREVVALYGGWNGRKAVAAPDRIEVARVADIYHPGPVVQFRESNSFAKPRQVPNDLVEELTSAMLAPEPYRWSVKSCEPDFNILLSFHRGSDRVDLLLSFFCNTLIAYKNGRLTGEKDFDDVRPQLVAVLKALFPDDDGVQSLKPRL